MKYRPNILIALAASICLTFTTTGASALLAEGPEKVVSIGTGQKNKIPAVLTAGYQPNVQIICLDRKPTGTRIKKRVCQTAAAWKSQLATERVRQHFLLQM